VIDTIRALIQNPSRSFRQFSHTAMTIDASAMNPRFQPFCCSFDTTKASSIPAPSVNDSQAA
jgi:hypothetical protein